MAKKRKKTDKKKTKNQHLSGLKSLAKKTSLKNLKRKKLSLPVDPLWTPDDGITFSILSKFLNCRQRFHIQQVQGWKPKHINYALEFGNILHLFIEAQDMGIDTDQYITIADNYVAKRLNDKACTDDEARELSMLALVAEVTYRKYLEYWEEYYLEFPTMEVREKDFRWIDKEYAFDVDYRMTDGRKVRLRGKMDGRFQLPREPFTWLLETKSKGRIDVAQITGGLHKDMQTGMYMLVQNILGRGMMPAGVLYNVIRRTQLKPRNGRGKAQTGRETPVMFAQRVSGDIDSRPDYYFLRWVREINSGEMETFRVRQFEPALHQLLTWWDSIKKNPMDPFNTECPKCKDPIVEDLEDLSESLDKHNCKFCGGTERVQNLNHYERAFGLYDAMQFSDKGDFFPIVTEDDYSNYERKKFAFPELEDEELQPYLEGTNIG